MKALSAIPTAISVTVLWWRITVVDLTDFDKGGFAKDATGAGKCHPPVIQAMPAYVSTPSRHVKCLNVSN
jgi:hypothetical protein